MDKKYCPWKCKYLDAPHDKCNHPPISKVETDWRAMRMVRRPDCPLEKQEAK